MLHGAVMYLSTGSKENLSELNWPHQALPQPKQESSCLAQCVDQNLSGENLAGKLTSGFQIGGLAGIPCAEVEKKGRFCEMEHDST